MAYDAVEGEAAFYGPKADFMAKDVLGREWQLSTIQVDFIQPARLGCEYIGEDGQPHTPVVIHRAVTGSTERFMGVLIEHFAGAFPVWLAPVQASRHPDRRPPRRLRREVAATLRDARAARRGRRQQRPHAGQDPRRPSCRRSPTCSSSATRRVEAGAVAVRLRTGENLGALPIDDFAARLSALVASRAVDLGD